MEFNDYQESAAKTAVFDAKDALTYLTMGLAGEAGEVSNTIKKVLRDDRGHVSAARREEVAKELGDVLWYVAQLARELKLDLDEIAESNLDKLYDRMNRGKLQGSGNER